MTGFEYVTYRGSKEGKVVEAKALIETLGPDEVILKVTHSGVCGTDLHYTSKDMVLGHEGVGVVQQVGSQVTKFKVGDRAGWGYLHDACLECEQCLKGDEIYCDKRHLYGTHELDQGAFASHAVWKAAFLFHIPDSLSSTDAAPLMCAGATVFTALQKLGVRSTDRVGVIGIGGLGHLAIQFAAKMGCEVVVFSGTESKREEAVELGADEFYATRGLEKLQIGSKLDYLIVTTSQQPDWSLYLPLMVPQGSIVPLSVSRENFNMPYMPLVLHGLRVQGSLTASRGIHEQMLRFAAHHKIKPIVQEYPLTLDGLVEAMDKLDQGQMKYRGVLVSQHP